MLIDSSSAITLSIIGLEHLSENLSIVPQIQGELDDSSRFRIYEVTKEELDTLINNLEIISKQINKQIYIEITKTQRYSKICLLNPLGAKGKFSIHYGELYLLAKCVSLSEELLCEDEDAYNILELLSGICRIQVKPISTIEFLYRNFLSGELSAIEFIESIKLLESSKRLYFRFPAKSRRDRYAIDTLYKFMQHLVQG
ncbi:MAG: hypothetical protein ACE5J9_09875 [Methanosarcinales archaeon]